MDMFIWLRAGLLLFTVLLYLFVRRKDPFPEIRPIIPQIFTLLFLGLVLSILTETSVLLLFNSDVLPNMLKLVIYFIILVAAVKGTGFLIFDFFIGKRQKIKYPRLIKDIVVIILYVIGILLIVKYHLEYPITVVLASSAVVTVVIGFALQDILGDLFSGIALNLEESLSLGDWIGIGDYEGRIEQFRWRSIKIRTTDNLLVLIPNMTASKKEVQRFGHKRENFALRMDIAVSYKSSPDYVIDTILSVLAQVQGVLKKPKPTVMVNAFADFAINYQVKFWLTDFSQKDPIKSEIRRKSWYAFKRRGIQIPFPIRDVYINRSQESREHRFSPEEIIHFLQKNDILATIDEKQLIRLVEDVEIKSYGGGELLIKDNEPGQYFYHILEGGAEVLKKGKVLSRLKEDDYVGEISLFTGEKTNADVRLNCESTILRLSSEKFRETVKMNEKMARKLSEVIALRKAELVEMTRQQDLTATASIKHESEGIFLRIKKYFKV